MQLLEENNLLTTFKNTFLVQEITTNQIVPLIRSIIALDEQGFKLERTIHRAGFIKNETMLDALAQVKIKEYPALSLKHAIFQHLMDNENISTTHKVDWLCNIANFEAYSEPHNETARTTLSALFYKKSKFTTPRRDHEGDAICSVYKELNAIINGHNCHSTLTTQWKLLVDNKKLHPYFFKHTTVKTQLFLLENAFEVVKDEYLINQWFKPLFLSFLQFYKNKPVNSYEFMKKIAAYKDGQVIVKMNEGMKYASLDIKNGWIELCVEIFSHVMLQKDCETLKNDYKQILNSLTYQEDIFYRIAENLEFSVEIMSLFNNFDSLFISIAEKQRNNTIYENFSDNIRRLCIHYLENNSSHYDFGAPNKLNEFIIQILDRQSKQISRKDLLLIINSLIISNKNKEKLVLCALARCENNFSSIKMTFDEKITHLNYAKTLLDLHSRLGGETYLIISRWIKIAFNILIKAIPADNTWTIENLNNCYNETVIKIFSLLVDNYKYYRTNFFMRSVQDDVKPSIDELFALIMNHNLTKLYDFILKDQSITIKNNKFNKLLIHEDNLPKLTEDFLGNSVKDNNTYAITKLFLHRESEIRNDNYKILQSILDDKQSIIQPKAMACIVANICNAQPCKDWIKWANLNLSNRVNRNNFKEHMIEKNALTIGFMVHFNFFEMICYNMDIITTIMAIYIEYNKENKLVETFIDLKDAGSTLDNHPQKNLLQCVPYEAVKTLCLKDQLTVENCNVILSRISFIQSKPLIEKQVYVANIAEALVKLNDNNLLSEKNRNALIYTDSPDQFCTALILLEKEIALADATRNLLIKLTSSELYEIIDSIMLLISKKMVTSELAEMLIANPNRAVENAKNIIYMHSNPQLLKFFKTNYNNNSNNTLPVNEKEKDNGLKQS